jgi:hypothetical protein
MVGNGENGTMALYHLPIPQHYHLKIVKGKYDFRLDVKIHQE